MYKYQSSLHYPMDVYEAPDPNVEYLCGADPVNTFMSKGFTLLMKWVMMTNEHPYLHDKIKEYIAQNPDEINKQNEKGWTALILASKNSNAYSTENTVKILLEAKANVNIINTHGFTALMFASRHSNDTSTENTVKMLLDANADVNIQQSNGWTALLLASRASNLNSTENTVKMLLDAGADVNLKFRGCTALDFACCTKQDSTENTVRMLIDAGADVNGLDDHGTTPLMFAVGCDAINIVKLLLNAGANVRKYDNAGRTVLSFPCNIDTKKILLDATNNWTIKDLLDALLPENILIPYIEEVCEKNNNKKLFSKKIIKHIPDAVNMFKLKYGTLSQKIITYNLELKTTDKTTIYKKICEKDYKLIDYLSIRDENDMIKLSDYVSLL